MNRFGMVFVAVSGVLAMSAACGSSADEASPDSLGPDGYRGVRLGMTVEQTLATGMFETVNTEMGQSRCREYPWKGHPAAEGGVEISATHGVVDIAALPSLSTPQDIRIGSSRAAAVRAYPDLHEQNFGWMAAVPGNSNATYFLHFADDKVSALALITPDLERDCV